ncbi:MAG: biotin--[acetyl-CoA-carboxylase] ligase [Bacteroidia bacterium]|nr:biotin--[acetyl-CoA-carboxylase] ligase [Bacteroidia bacterium]
MYKIPAKTLFFGKNLIYVPECHSTNDLAWELVKTAKAGEGTIVITSNQTAGRGQRGNAWEATAGLNLTFSIVFKPTFLAPHQQFALNMFSSLAVAQALAEANVPGLRVKWPNDVMSGARKMVGILVENTVQANRINHTVAGIGINVNQQAFDVPNATSINW